jgi:hypothetical protein
MADVRIGYDAIILQASRKHFATPTSQKCAMVIQYLI